MTLPSVVTPALGFAGAAAPVPSPAPAPAGAETTGTALSAALPVADAAPGRLALPAVSAGELRFSRGPAADSLASQAAWISAPSMPANGTGTPFVPFNIDAIPMPESAIIERASPISLSATFAQTLFRNVARVRPNHEGRAAGVGRP